jgi:hypothetical protein
MVYDSDRRRVVLFGGYLSPGAAYTSETWEWDGAQWLFRTAQGPLPRTGHAMAYDSGRHRTVLFGGSTTQSTGSDTWEWDGLVWVSIPSLGPSARSDHAMAYDSARGRTVLFGGVGSTYRGDTWEWDGAAWIQRGVGGPLARGNAAMVFDSSRARVVLFGGRQNAAFGDTWEWSGSGDWVQVSGPGPDSPSPRYSAMAFDQGRGRTVLFGGDPAGETWEWDGAAWALRTSSTPAPRMFTAMAYDAARGQTVLFGGAPYASGLAIDDTWTWDGSAAPAPVITQQPMAVSVPSSSPVVLHVAATGMGPLAYRWRRGGVPISDGGTVSGAATDTLRIDPAAYSDSGMYDVVVTSACNIPVASARVPVQVTCAAYYANCDGSTFTPILNVNDFICFLTKYAQGDSYANCDGSTIPPVLNVNDFICFQNKYITGCP